MPVAKRKKGEQRQGTCAYCGKEGPITRDHVIPRTLFTVLDNQMVTVPACAACQIEKSRGERDLRNYCNWEIGGSMHPDAETHIRKVLEKADERTKEWLRKALAEAEEVILVDEDDNEVGRTWAIDFNTDRMVESLKFIFKGLYYVTHNEQRLPDGTPVEVTIVPWTIFPDFMRRFGAMRLEPHPTVSGGGRHPGSADQEHREREECPHHPRLVGEVGGAARAVPAR